MTPQHSVPCPLHAAARRAPEAPALVGPERTLLYGALDRMVTAAAGRLRAHGCAAGDRVACRLPNGERHLVVLLALLRVGAAACPLSTREPPQRLPALLQQTGARLLLADGEEGRTGEPAGVDVLPAADVVPDGPPGERMAVPGERLALEQAATVVFTSGSTGAPKAALHTVGNHYFSAKGSNANIALAPGDRWLLSLPLYHVGGLAIVFRCLLAGAAVTVPERNEPLGAALERYSVTHASMVGTQLYRLLQGNQDTSRLRRLRALLLGGSALAPALLEEAYGRGLPVHTSYGLTEMASQVTTTPPGASMDLLRTAGRLLPHRELKIAADGEIMVRGKTLFQGYVDGRSVHRPTGRDGWFPTGDLGALDARGALDVHGRKDHRFISGGENIQPEEIEAALAALPSVARAVVVPVPDAEFGQRPVAFVELAGEGSLPTDLAAQLEGRLPRFKIPDAFYDWPAGAGEAMKADRTFFLERALEHYR